MSSELSEPKLGNLTLIFATEGGRRFWSPRKITTAHWPR